MHANVLVRNVSNFGQKNKKMYATIVSDITDIRRFEVRNTANCKIKTETVLNLNLWIKLFNSFIISFFQQCKYLDEYLYS